MLRTYIPSRVKVTIFGVEIKGFSKESFIRISRIDDATTFRKAQDGSHTAFIDKFASYRVSLNVDQTSESNEILHLIFKIYQKAGVEFKIPFEIEERTRDGGTRFNAFDVFFENEPETGYSSTTEGKEWVLVCHNAAYTQKGTVDTGDLLEAIQSILHFFEMTEAFGVDLSGLQDKLVSGLSGLNQKLQDAF